MESVQTTFVLSSPQDTITLSPYTESVSKTDTLDCCELKPHDVFLYIYMALWHYLIMVNTSILYAQSVLITHTHTHTLTSSPSWQTAVTVTGNLISVFHEYVKYIDLENQLICV